MPDGIGGIGTAPSAVLDPFQARVGNRDRTEDPGPFKRREPKVPGAKDQDAGAEDTEAADIAKLKARDQEVRAHEAAHLAAAGGLARGGASFTYEKGPDGRLYAIGGEVSIDTSPVSGDPAATLAKARRIQASALAPADPSGQDRAVAAAAAALAVQAAQALARRPAAGATGTRLDQEA